MFLKRVPLVVIHALKALISRRLARTGEKTQAQELPLHVYVTGDGVKHTVKRATREKEKRERRSSNRKSDSSSKSQPPPSRTVHITAAPLKPLFVATNNRV